LWRFLLAELMDSNTRSQTGTSTFVVFLGVLRCRLILPLTASFFTAGQIGAEFVYITAR
jgi:hypothetical protein